MDQSINPILLSELEKLSELLCQEDGLECTIELVDDGLLVQANRAALLHIANRILGLVDAARMGGHFTIDRADIAPEAEVTLTIALNSE